MKYEFYLKGRKIVCSGLENPIEWMQSPSWNNFDFESKKELIKLFISNNQITDQQLQEIGINPENYK